MDRLMASVVNGRRSVANQLKEVNIEQMLLTQQYASMIGLCGRHALCVHRIMHRTLCCYRLSIGPINGLHSRRLTDQSSSDSQEQRRH